MVSPESQAAQLREKRRERGTVTTSAGDNVPVCAPGQAPGTMEQQSSTGNNDPIEGYVTWTSQNANSCGCVQGSSDLGPELFSSQGLGLSQTVSHMVLGTLLVLWCLWRRQASIYLPYKVLIFEGSGYGRSISLQVREVEPCAWGWERVNCVKTKTKRELSMSLIKKY